MAPSLPCMTPCIDPKRSQGLPILTSLPTRNVTGPGARPGPTTAVARARARGRGAPHHPRVRSRPAAAREHGAGRSRAAAGTRPATAARARAGRPTAARARRAPSPTRGTARSRGRSRRGTRRTRGRTRPRRAPRRVLSLPARLAACCVRDTEERSAREARRREAVQECNAGRLERLPGSIVAAYPTYPPPHGRRCASDASGQRRLSVGACACLFLVSSCRQRPGHPSVGFSAQPHAGLLHQSAVASITTWASTCALASQNA